MPLGPAINDFSASNPVPTLAANFVVYAREKVGGAKFEGGQEFLTISHNHASERRPLVKVICW